MGIESGGGRGLRIYPQLVNQGECCPDIFALDRIFFILLPPINADLCANVFKLGAGKLIRHCSRRRLLSFSFGSPTHPFSPPRSSLGQGLIPVKRIRGHPPSGLAPFKNCLNTPLAFPNNGNSNAPSTPARICQYFHR